MKNGTLLGGGGRPTQVLTQSHDMEELRPDLLPVSSAPSTGASDTANRPFTTITTTATSNGSVGGGGGSTVVDSGLSVISTAVPSQQSQQLVRLPAPPSKGAVPVGVTLALAPLNTLHL